MNAGGLVGEKPNIRLSLFQRFRQEKGTGGRGVESYKRLKLKQQGESKITAKTEENGCTLFSAELNAHYEGGSTTK